MNRMLAIAAIFCMGSSLPTLKYRALDSDGDPISGALLYFYEAGTTTPLATYSDEDLSSANANPVVADSDGWFGEIYLKTDEAYKVVLKNSDASTTYWTIDDVNAAQLTSASVTTRLKQVASNPIDYGAVGDGVADEYSYVQSAIDNATEVVDLLGKTYRCDTTITISSNNIIIKNGTLNFSSLGDPDGISIAGSASSSIALTSSPSIAANEFDLESVSGLSSGDWLLIYSSDQWASGSYRSELTKIKSISSLTVTTMWPLQASYTTGNNAVVYKINAVESVRFVNVKFIGSKTNPMGLVSIADSIDISFHGCSFESYKRYAIALNSASKISVDECTFDNGYSSSYGLYAAFTNQWIDVEKSTFHTEGSGVGIGLEYGHGQTRFVNISENEFQGVLGAIEAGVASQYVTIAGNEIDCDSSGGSDSVKFLGNDLIVNGNTIRYSGGDAISVDSDVTYDDSKEHRYMISNNTVITPTAGALYAYPSNHSAIISGNHFIDMQSGQSAIEFDITAESGVMIENNIIQGDFAYGVELSGSYGAQIVGNRFNCSNDTGTILYFGRQSTITGNSLDGCSNSIEIETATNGLSIISGNRIASPNDNGIFIDGSVREVSITGNIFHVPGAAALDMDTGASFDRSVFSGNTVRGSAHNLIHLIDSDSITISGNYLYSEAPSALPIIDLDGDAAGAVDGVTITGNAFDTGTYAVGETTDANNLNVIVADNTYANIATSNYQGTVTVGTQLKAAANTACNTTCGNDTCFAGYDDGVPAVVVCTDATADRCVCFP